MGATFRELLKRNYFLSKTDGETETGRQADRQAGRQTGRQADRQTDRQAAEQTETQTKLNKQIDAIARKHVISIQLIERQSDALSD